MIETLHLFRPLNERLIILLRNVSKDEWNARTVAREWSVKDVAAHLLDGNIRAISIYRDGITLSPDVELQGYEDVVKYLNRLNADWVKAMKRMSTVMLTDLLEETHEAYVQSLEKLDPKGQAIFSVDWAGEKKSQNWFHTAREFTEKWHHHQQIREAVHQPGILTKQFYLPVLDTFMRALPFRYEKMEAPTGTCVAITIGSPIEKTWWVGKEKNSWTLLEKSKASQASVIIPAELSWKIFTKAVQYSEVRSQIRIEGEEKLALPALQMITVMA